MCVGGNHWVGVGGSVSVGSTVPKVDVAAGGSVGVTVDVGVGPLVSDCNTSIETPMQ